MSLQPGIGYRTLVIHWAIGHWELVIALGFMNVSPLLNRAVFLDRDGVINRVLVRDGKPYPAASLAEFEILPGVAGACRLLKSAGFYLVVATNQPDVGRGTLAREVVEAMHARMCQLLPI